MNITSPLFNKFTKNTQFIKYTHNKTQNYL